ncbi:MAG TPA: Tim44-like domain-containing protein [Candidatus Dormibacteraeota bacterium]|nr:Tim44-like domain-containing protein [Candidatus Dormibacteraeota bacterium]
MRKVSRRLLTLAITFALILVLQLPALARAGGGHSSGGGSSGGGHSSGGGYSSGSSHTSSGSGGGSFFYVGGNSGGTLGDIIFLLFILGAGIAVYVWWKGRQSSDSSGGGDVSVQPIAEIDTEAVRSGLGALTARDPNFNQQVFLDRAQTTFFVLQNAWMARNLEPARIYLSDAIYQRWKLQVDQFVVLHKRDVMEDLAVNGCAIAKVAGDPNFDSITVRFDAIAADYEVDDANKIVSGDKVQRPFTEFWTFIRSRAVQTRAGETAQITQCPNCGAPVQINESGTCAYCKATVTTGQFGWVLNTITQADEWSAAA